MTSRSLIADRQNGQVILRRHGVRLQPNRPHLSKTSLMSDRCLVGLSGRAR